MIKETRYGELITVLRHDVANIKDETLLVCSYFPK